MLALFEHYSSILVAFFPENFFSENMKIRVIFPAKTYGISERTKTNSKFKVRRLGKSQRCYVKKCHELA